MTKTPRDRTLDEIARRAWQHLTHVERLPDGRVRLVCRCGATREADNEEFLGWRCDRQERRDI